MVGTANGSNLPPDPSGNRRLVAIETKDRRAKEAVEGYMARNRDQLWAEALAAYERGDRANLDYRHAQTHKLNNARYRSPDHLAEMAVAEYVEGKDQVNTVEMLEAWPGDNDNRDPRAQIRDWQIARVLESMDWTQGTATRGKRRVRVWNRPVAPP